MKTFVLVLENGNPLFKALVFLQKRTSSENDSRRWGVGSTGLFQSRIIGDGQAAPTAAAGGR
jgi:hypothetical protein